MRESLHAHLTSRVVPAALLILAMAAWLLHGGALLNDGDTSWHIATGHWILEHHRVPDADPFSFTHRGQPWTAHEWLIDLLMALLMNLAGWSGLVVVFALAVSFTLWVIARELLRILAWQRALGIIALLIAVLAPSMLARPHVIAWPLFALWALALLRARDKNEAPPWALALLILPWANLHASFIFAIFLAAVFAMEALVVAEDRKMTFVQWGQFGLISGLGAFATPHGLQAVLYPFQVSGMTSLQAIDEWRATNVREDWLFLLFACGVAVCTAVRWRDLTVVRLMLLGILAILAFAHSRHQPLFVILSTLILARSTTIGDGRRVRVAPGTMGAIAISFALLAAIRLSNPVERGDSPTYPAATLANLPPSLRNAPVLNSYSFGGPLILAGIAPFIDGRADMYGDAHTLDHLAIMGGDATRFERARSRWNLQWTILHKEEKLVRLLDRDPRWRRLNLGGHAVVHVRN